MVWPQAQNQLLFPAGSRLYSKLKCNLTAAVIRRRTINTGLFHGEPARAALHEITGFGLNTTKYHHRLMLPSCCPIAFALIRFNCYASKLRVRCIHTPLSYLVVNTLFMASVHSKLRLFLFCSFMCFVLSCTKTNDVSSDRLSTAVSDNSTVLDLSKCKMRRIYQDVGGQRQTAVFSYNGAGNPYSVLYANNGTGNPNHFFVYDSKNRMREYHKTYGSFIVERHKYGYNANNQIVKDTMISKEAGVHYESISTIEYDPAGRVIKETIVNTFNDSGPLESTRRPTYTYDSRGNLGVLNWKSSSYDNKINPLRQSKEFQFIFRNYSMNNPAVQAKYNSIGLPLSLHPSNDYFFNSPVTYQIVYECQ
jgi:hypothetical protein